MEYGKIKHFASGELTRGGEGSGDGINGYPIEDSGQKRADSNSIPELILFARNDDVSPVSGHLLFLLLLTLM